MTRRVRRNSERGVCPPPPDRGVRLDWADMPRRVRSEIERWLGGAIVDAVTQPTGFSPGVAARPGRLRADHCLDHLKKVLALR